MPITEVEVPALANVALSAPNPTKTHHQREREMAQAINQLLADIAGHSHSSLQAKSEKNAPNGYAGLDASTLLAVAQIPVSIARLTDVTSSINAHSADTSGAHVAAGIEVDDSAFSNIVGADLQTVLDWLDDNGGGGGATTLDGLSDVVVSAPVTGHVLRHDGATFVNVLGTDHFEVAGAVSAHAALSDPHSGYQRESEKGAAGGYASLDGSGDVPDAQLPVSIARVADAVMDGDAAGGGLTGTYPNPTVANNQVGNNRMADMPALTVKANPTNATADPQDVAAASDGDVLRRSGTTLGFGTVATAGIADNAVSNAKLRDSTGMSVIGRSGGSSGDPADIVASADGQVLGRRSGALTFAQVATTDIADTAVQFAKIQNLSTNRLIGRTSAGAGPMEEILIGSGLQLSGLTLSATGGGSFDPTMGGDLSGVASAAQIIAGAVGDVELRDSAALSVIGRAANSTGDPADIAAGTDGHVLRRSGTTLGFGQLTLGAIPDGLLTLAKHANVASDRLLGRDTAGSGAPEELTVGGGLEFTGAGGIQRSALTGDVTAAAGSGTTVIANNAVTKAKIEDFTAASLLLGRGSSAGGGDPQEISLGSGLVMTGAVLSATGGGGPGGTVAMGGDLSGQSDDAQIVANAVGNAELRDSSALSVIGRNANSVGDPADIAAAAGSGAVLRELTTGPTSVIGFGQVATAGIEDAAVTSAKLRNSGGVSVIGRAANSTGVPADITAAANDTVFGRRSNALTFAQVATAEIADNAVTLAKVQDITTARLLGRSTVGTGDIEQLTVGSGLSLSGGVLSATGVGTAVLQAQVVVASNDAPAAVKALADFTCDGTADQVQINAAIALAAPLQSRNAASSASAQQRGTVLLSGGEFFCAGPILMQTGTELAGSGRLTIIKPVSGFTNAGAGPDGGLIKQADVDVHTIALRNFTLDGVGSGTATCQHGIYLYGLGGDMTGYPGASPDAWHDIGPDIWIKNFSGGASARHGVYLNQDLRGTIIDGVRCRSIRDNGFYIAQAPDGHMSNCKAATISGTGFYINGGNWRLGNLKAAYCDTYGFRIASGRCQGTILEAQDCGTGFFFDAAPFVGSGITADTCQTDGILVSSNEVRLGEIQVFLRAGGRYATQTNGLRFDAAYTDGMYLGGVNPSNITNPITGTLPTAANRNFARVSNGSGSSIALSVG